MKESKYKSYEDLPLFLMNENDFPALRMGSRVVVPKDKFRQWVEQRSGGGS